jgi:glycosyltransferase involved in cell wall biosynthesis
MGNDLRKSVLVICPWMDHSTFSRGMVFREQARVLKDDFNYTFLNFQKFGISDVLKFRSLVRRKPFYDDNFKESYVYVYYLNSSYFFSWLNSWIEKLAVNAVYKAFCVEKKSFQLIHVQCLIDSGVFGYLLGKKMNLPYIITEHAQINLVGISVKRHKFLQVVLNEAKRRLLVSRHKIAQYATGRLYGEFEVVGNMVNESNFFYLPKPQTNNFKIITVGAYTPIKDQLTLLKALKLRT